jgi:hypothetical protein
LAVNSEQFLAAPLRTEDNSAEEPLFGRAAKTKTCLPIHPPTLVADVIIVVITCADSR